MDSRDFDVSDERGCCLSGFNAMNPDSRIEMLYDGGLEIDDSLN